MKLCVPLLLLAIQLRAASSTNTAPAIELRRTPFSGLQPEVAAGEDQTVHLVYFKGDPGAGDLFYSKSRDGIVFTPPVRVNSVERTAIAIGNIRGARIAVGQGNIVHIVWNGTQRAADSTGRIPMLYSRLMPKQKSFEPERNLIHTAYGLDGGSGIAADQSGRVYVFWHAPIPGQTGEESRRVWMTRSDDSGRTFEPEKMIWNQPTGACACCSLNAFADARGKIYVLFRSAREMIHRDMYLLESGDHGATFRGSDISNWEVGYCVMSSESFTEHQNSVFAAWETDKRVQFARIRTGAGPVIQQLTTMPDANQKYPALAVNASGDLLVVWTEGMGWKRGGSVHWQLFDPEGRPVGAPGSQDGVPAWSLVAAYAKPDGNFVILY